MKRPKHPKRRTSDASRNGHAEKPLEVQSLFKLFPALDPDKIERLAAEMSLVRFKRGDRILVDLQPPTDIFLVLKGAIAVNWQRDSRHQVLVTVLAPGEIFGVSSLLPEMAQGLKGHAFTNSLLATIDSTRLLDIVLGVQLGAFKSAVEMTLGWSVETLMRYIRMYHLSPRDRLVIALSEMGAKFGVRDSERPDPESADYSEGSGRPARLIAAECQRAFGRAGAVGRGDQSEPSDRPGPGKAARTDRRSRSPLPRACG